MKIGITGATGMIGQALARLAADSGHTIIRYSRAKQADGWLRTTEANPLPETSLDALVHLAGESLLGFWTQEKRKRMWQSRVDLTKQIVTQLMRWQAHHRPKVLICASGVGFYGDRADTVLDEHSTPGSGYLAELCQAWEAAALKAREMGLRVVLLRTSMVLGREGGAFPLMRRAFSLGLGGRLGSGQQWMSWIHEQDQAALILWALENEHIAGPLNLCSPHPVTNADFTCALAAALHRPAFMHAPAFALRRLMPGMAQEMLLTSQRATPRLALESGYRFAHPDLGEAMRDLLAR